MEQFRRIAPFGKRVFIDKPFAVSSSDGEALIDLAKKHGVTLMSSSSLRYAEGVANELASTDGGRIIGADCFGPMPWQPTQPGYFILE